MKPAQIAATFFVLPLALASATAWASPPPRAKVGRPTLAKAVRRAVVATAVLGATGVAMAAPGEEAPLVMPPSLTTTYTMRTDGPYMPVAQPDYASIARTQLKAIGAIPAAPHFKSIQEHVNSGALKPLHRLAEAQYMATGSPIARAASFITDPEHIRYRYNVKTHAWAVEYHATF